MGGGASAIDDRTLIINEVESQKLKPLDASDVPDFDSAILEITKLRNFFNMLNMDEIKMSLEGLDSGRRRPAGEEAAAATNDAGGESAGGGSDDGRNAVRGQAIVSVLADKMAQRFDSLKDSFLFVDTDKSGYISRREFQEACWQWGILLSPDDFALLDASYLHEERLGEPDRGINYREFIALMTRQLTYIPGTGSGKQGPSDLSNLVRAKILGDADTMREAFKKLDRDGSGTVERSEMRRMLDMYNIKYSDEDFEELFQQHDKNGDDRFSYGEFVQLLQGRSP